MKYREIEEALAQRLKEAGIDEAGTDARYIVCESAGVDLSRYLLIREDEPDRETQERISEYGERRRQHEPLQYILGKRDFMEFCFKCTPACLIPRQDTEILAEEAVKTVKKLGGDVDVLDICTGTGCVIISVAGMCRLKSATGADISEEALELARENAGMNSVNVRFIKSDLFNETEGRFSVITANPPYIKRASIAELMPEVTDFEPRLALDGGEDGLDFYRRIAAEAGAHLLPGGFLIMEMDDDQAEAVADLLKENNFEEIRVIKDYAGLNRVISAVWR